LRRIPARLIGLGIRPEHVETRERLAPGNRHQSAARAAHQPSIPSN
jgi:hypothetical protein